MPASTYYKTLVLNKTLRNINFELDSLYLGLLNDTTINDTNYLSIELSGNGYSRMPVSFDSTWKNDSIILWLPTLSWGDVKAVGLYSTMTGPYLLMYKTITTVSMQPYMGLRIPVGGLTVSIT